MSIELAIGGVKVGGRAWLAPMTGVSDLPCRLVAAKLGASYVATEMVAGAELARGRPDVVRRAAIGEGLPLMVVQLVGRDPAMMAAGARIAEAAGAQIIDINFGCPAKEVTGAACGSALMRDPELAARIIGGVVDAVQVPVTVKMRLGWDEASKNAPQIAAQAQALGARAITVHGRTRQQFYKGVADWRAIGEVRQAIEIPLIANGDIVDVESARTAMAQSGADAVMIGRGAYGRPWLAAQIDAELEGRSFKAPSMEERLDLVLDHYRATLAFYGERLGGKMFRKHLGWYIEAAPWPEGAEVRRAAKARLCAMEDTRAVEAALTALWSDDDRRLAA